MYLRFIIVATIALSLAAAQEPSPPPDLQVSDAGAKFADALYKALARDYEDADLFFSPLGVHAALSMLYQGAGATTKNALAAALRVAEPSVAAEGYGRLLGGLRAVRNVTLHVANRVFVTRNFTLLPDYGLVLREKFGADAESVDFFSGGGLAAEAVNAWVRRETAGKIARMVEEEDFTRDTRLVLLDAVYFKGGWKERFDAGLTRTEPFFRGEGRRDQVQMMHLQGGFNYKNDFKLHAEVLELPFQDDSINMYIVLPFEKYGITGLERRIQDYGVEQVFTGLQFDDALYVSIPKFKLELSMDLVEPLKRLGLDSLFSEGDCNLSKVAKSDGNLYVSKAIQKSFFEITEEGAEAAAATGMFLIDRDLRTPVQFYANHPFLVILKQGHNVLFYGRIMKPISGSGEAAPSAESTYHELNALRVRCIQCQQAVQGQCDMCTKIDWTSFSSEGA